MKNKSYLLPELIFILPLFLLFSSSITRFALVFIFLLLVSGQIWINILKKNIVSFRKMNQKNIFFGERNYVDVFVENRSILPAPYLIIKDKPDIFLNFIGPKSFLLNLKGKEKRRIRYTMQGKKRGQFILRDWYIETSDLFGRSKLSLVFKDRKLITVYPKIYPIKKISNSYKQPFGEIKNKYPIFEEKNKLYGIRDYRPGDDKRNINWKLSAKSGDLMINQYTPSISRTTLFFMSMYKDDFPQRFRDFYLELGIQVAASLMNFFFKANQKIGLAVKANFKEIEIYDDDFIEKSSFRNLLLTPKDGNQNFTYLLESLSKLQLQDKVPFVNIFEELTSISSSGNEIIVIAPDISFSLTKELITIKNMGYEVSVVIFTPSPQKHYKVSSFGIPVIFAKQKEDSLKLEFLYG